jgi:hypothetical protein
MLSILLEALSMSEDVWEARVFVVVAVGIERAEALWRFAAVESLSTEVCKRT